MTTEQLKSLNEDELAMLWYCINKINPPVIADIEMEPSLFMSINHRRLMDRLLNCVKLVKEEHRNIITGLTDKLKV